MKVFRTNLKFQFPSCLQSEFENREIMGSPATGRKISIWWDMESCPFPQNINSRSIARLSDILLYPFRINGHVHQFCAYDNFDRVDERLKQTLGNSAIRLRHVPPGKLTSILFISIFLCFQNERRIWLYWGFVFCRKERICGESNVGGHFVLVDG